MTLASAHTLFARQPICDATQRIAGYELLFRGERAADGAILDDRAATAQVLLSAFDDIGLDGAVGTHRAFVNVSARFLLDVDPLPIRPERVVLELLENAEPTPRLLGRLDELRADGYTIALDDFSFEPSLAPLLSRADIIKVDIRALGVREAARQAAMLSPHARMLAEKVEDAAEQAACAAAGFELFQGWWFCRPELVRGKQIASSLIGRVGAAADLASPGTGLREIEAAVRLDAGLSLRLLRHLNSAAMALPHRVMSVHQAVVLLGERRLKQWVMLHLLAGLGEGRQALLTTAIVRARTCELLAASEGAAHPDAWFATGLFSVVDALAGAPMTDVVAGLPLDEAVKAALVDRAGPMGAALGAAESCESGNATEPAVLRVYDEAVAWSAGQAAGIA
jgi:c-di-GMP phosphodiesterase